MPARKFGAHPDEDHDNFIARAGKVFPASQVGQWSPVERAVFNRLMFDLVSRHSCAAITEAMLLECRDDMQEIVRRCAAERAAGDPGNH